MEFVSTSDFYEIRLASIVSNVDKDVLVELYQPLIGAAATMLYLTLLKQRRNNDEENLYVTEQLINITQFAPGMILSARHMLEAVGLLRTYEKKTSDGRYYVYVLYSPKSPKDFFDDVLFKGLLIQYVGEKEAKRLAFKYKINLEIPEEYSEVSASFIDVFHPNYDDPSFRKDFGNSIVGHEPGRVKINFNFDSFYKYLNERAPILPSAFYKRDLKEIERLATLFGLDESQMAVIVADEYEPHANPHLDYRRVAEKAEDAVKYRIHAPKARVAKSKVSGKTITSEKVRLMDDVTPAYFLRMLQNNTEPAKADLKIIDGLSSGYNLPNGIINVIIDYTLNKNNNILSKNFCEKIAASLVRENIQTTIDAMNYLNKVSLVTKKEMSTKGEEPKEVKKEVKEVTEDISDEEMNDILTKLDLKKKGGKK